MYLLITIRVSSLILDLLSYCLLISVFAYCPHGSKIPLSITAFWLPDKLQIFSSPLCFLFSVLSVRGCMLALTTRKCTWSCSVPISKNLISYRASIPRHISCSFLSTYSLITALRYFARHTIWYIRVLTLCSLRMISLILPVYHHLQPPQSGGVLNRIGLRLIKIL